MKKVVFLGAKPIGLACLTLLQQQAQQLQWQIIAVGTNPQNTLQSADTWLQYCQQQNLPLLTDLEALPECDFIISVQYHRILKPRHIERAKQIALNLHLAPLPEYRGCNQFSFAIIDQASTFGATLHRLEADIDSGDILFERRFEIPPQCFVQQLYDRTCTAAIELFERHIGDVASGNYSLTPQNALVAQRGTSYHYRHEIAQLKEIDLNWSAEKIARHIRATYFPPFEPPFAWVAGKKVYFQLSDI